MEPEIIHRCAKCGEPDVIRVKLLGNWFSTTALCRCQKEAREREEQEAARRAFQEEISRNRSVAFTDRTMRGFTFENDDGSNDSIKHIALRYAEKFRTIRKSGKGLLFFGAVGNGKTFFAGCIANYLIDRGYKVLFTNIYRLEGHMKHERDRDDYLDSLESYDLLIVDDFGTERDTEYMNEIVFQIIDARYRSGLPMIITSNITAEELGRPEDIKNQRIYSRILDRCIPIEFTGKDRRRDNLSGKARDFIEWLQGGENEDEN